MLEDLSPEDRRIVLMALGNWDGYDSQTKATHFAELDRARELYQELSP